MMQLGAIKRAEEKMTEDELNAKPKYYFSRYVVDNGLSNHQDLKTFS